MRAGRYPSAGAMLGFQQAAGAVQVSDKGQTPSNPDTRVTGVTNRGAGGAVRSLVSQEGKNAKGELIG